jgi:Porin PorA
MRRIAGYLVLMLGVACLVVAPLLRFWVYPQAAKFPLNQDMFDSASGPGYYFSPAQLKLIGPVQLTVNRQTKGIAHLGSSSMAVWDTFQQIDGPDGKPIPQGAVVEHIPMNRRTGAAIACCDEQPAHSGAHTLVLPFDSKRTIGGKPATYLYWDAIPAKAFDVTYVRTLTDPISGLRVYEYRGAIKPFKYDTVELPESVLSPGSSTALTPVDRWYENTDYTIDVEPRTGVILNGHSSPHMWFQSSDGTRKLDALKISLKVTRDSVLDLAKKARDGKRGLTLLGVVLPLVALVLGIVLVALWWLLLRPRGGASSDAPEAVGRHSPQPV